MIRHSVILKLKSGISPEEKAAFFDAIDKLAFIPDVQKFEVLKQISSKNKFEYGISMEFDTQEHYDFYSDHPDHVYFVQHFWLKNVEDFLEIDYTLLNGFLKYLNYRKPNEQYIEITARRSCDVKRRRLCPNYASTRLPNSPERGQTTRLVALDEREYHQRRDSKRFGMDGTGWNWWVSKLRC